MTTTTIPAVAAPPAGLLAAVDPAPPSSLSGSISGRAP